MTEQSGKSLSDLLTEVGRDPVTRDAMVSALAEWEARQQKHSDGVDLRETVTGPLVDALFKTDGAVTRRLSSGLVFTLPYRSKIAREFAMGSEPLNHVWEPQTSRLLVALAARAKTVVVGGAYAGDQAILIARALSAHGGSVHCFELNPPQLRALELNAQQNGLRNVVVNAMGLWDRSGHIELVGHDSHAFPRFITTPLPDSFPVTTIEAYADKAKLPNVDLIMLDIEGGEEHALRGAQRFLEMKADQAPDIVFEIHRSYVDWSHGLAQTSLVRLLSDRGYSVYALRDYQANVEMAKADLEMVRLETAVLDGPPHGFNMFATKRPAALSELHAKLRDNVSPKLLRHRLSHIHQPG